MESLYIEIDRQTSVYIYILIEREKYQSSISIVLVRWNPGHDFEEEQVKDETRTENQWQNRETEKEGFKGW